MGEGCLRAGAVFPRPTLPAGRDFGPVRTSGAFPPAAARQARSRSHGRLRCPKSLPIRHSSAAAQCSNPWDGGIAPVLTFWLHRFASLGLKSRINARFLPRMAPRLQRFASLGLKSRIDARICLKSAPRLQRFASLGLKSRITARFLPRMAPRLQRFASLGLKSRIDARFCQRSAPRLHRFASLGLKSRINAAPSCQQVEWPACSRRCRYGAASDSNFRRRKVEQFHLQ